MLIYVVWYWYLINKKQFTRPLLIIAIAHLPYLFLNVVAPFRGVLDPNYGHYVSGLIFIPQGITVTLVSGTIAICSLVIATRALKNNMDGKWGFTLGLDLILGCLIAFPSTIELIRDLEGSKLQLGEYLLITGPWLVLIVLCLFTLPTLYSILYSGKKYVEEFTLKNRQKDGEYE